MRRFFRATYYLAGTVFFLTVAIAGFTQTKTFRTYLHGKVAQLLAEELHADVQFGPLEGNLITGLRIDGITLSSGGEVIVQADRLEAMYEPMGVLIDRVAFSEIKLTNPVVRLVRSRDGSWNINRLAAAPSSPDTAQQPSNFVVSVRNLQLDNAEFLVIDSLKMEAYDTLRARNIPVSVAEYPMLRLHGLKLNASARVDAKGIEAAIQHLSFVSDQPSFALTSLIGEFEFGASGTSIQKLSVETPESRFTLDASLEEVDLTKLSAIRELERKPLRASVSVERLNLAELRRLFPSALEALDKAVAMEARIGGSIDRLHVERMTVRTPRSVVNVEGMLTNLHRPGSLEMDLVSVDNTLDPAELPVYLPNVNLPDMAGMGDLTYNVRFTGKPSAFTVRFEGQSGAGNLIADAELEMKKNVMEYRGKLTTEGLNLGALLGDPGLASSFFSTVTFDGKGTDLQTMTGTARVEFDSSAFYGIQLGASLVTAEIAGGMLRTQTNITAGKTALNLTGTAGFQEGSISNYTLDGTVESFNLASVLKNAHYASELSFGIAAQGRGVTFGDMQTKLQLLFGPSTFGEHAFAESKVVAELDALNSTKQTFHLTSDVTDIDIEGTFNLDSFIATLYQSVQLIAEAIDHRLGSLVALRESQDATVERRFESTLRSIPQPVDARYTIVVRDFFPIGVFLGYRMAGNGVISGEIAGSLDELQLKGAANLDAFVYADNTVAIGAYGADLSYSVDDVSRVKILDAVHAKIDFSGRRLDVNETMFSMPELFVDIRGATGSYEVQALIDSAVGVHADGSSLYENGFITYTMDTLIVDAQSYRFANNAPVTATLGQDGLSIGNFWMKHGDEEVKIAGIFNPNGASELNIEVVNFLLHNLQLLSANKEFVRDVRALSGSVNATANFSGPFENPSMSLNLAAEDVRHGETRFGQIIVRGSYAERLLDGFVELRSNPEDSTLPPDFVLSGFLPYDLALTNRSQTPLAGEMNLTMQSRGLRLQLIDPFISELANLSGTMVCDVAIRGTVDQPRYEGSLALQGAQFLFTPLGITYIVDGQFIPAGQRIALENFHVKNIQQDQQDQQDGAVTFSGSFTLDGLTLRDFDLLANGQLLVMKESSRQPGQALYGTVFVATGPNGLHWQGTPQRSVVSGKVYVRNANLTLPPTRDVLINTNRDVILTVIDDTTRHVPGKLQGSNGANGTNGSALVAVNNGSTAFSQIGSKAARSDQSDDGQSFLDRLVYNLDVETQGPTYVRFVFNPYTGEELFAELKGRMAFSKDASQTRLTGEVEVGDRSYYNFLKRFQATGKLTFTGDALNPELNILAKYESSYQLSDSVQASGTRPAHLQSLAPSFNPTRVVVLLNITGTRQEPKPKFSIEFVDAAGTRAEYASGDVESEAISFILTGSFRDELTQQERSSILGPNLIYGLTSSVLSGPITDYIKKEFKYISSVDVIYYGGDVQASTDVRVTGEYREVVVRLGGRVLNDPANTNVSVQLPMSTVLGSEGWRNLILEIERRVEGVESYEQRRELNGLRLIYRITF